MNRSFFYLLTWLCGQALFAQVTVSGQVVDADGTTPVPYATVSALSPDSSLLGGSLTLDDGSFVLNIASRGRAQITVSYIGYAPQTKELFIGANNDIYNVGKILLRPDAQTLEQVTVTGERATIGGAPDKKTFDLSDQQAQGGGSVLDAMKALPGVTITQDGELQLRGSDRVAVLIDGKQSAMTGYGNQRSLGSIPAGNIERIEIINTPSAKYDAFALPMLNFSVRSLYSCIILRS